MKNKFRSIFAEKCTDFGLTEKCIDELCELGYTDINDESSDEDIIKKVDLLIPFAKAMQREITRKTQKGKQSAKQSNETIIEGKGEGENVMQNNAPIEVVPQWAQTLIDQNKTLKQRLDRYEIERTANSRKTQFKAVISKLPENLRKPYERTQIEELKDDEFDSLMTEVNGEVDAIMSEMRQKGVIFQPPFNGTGSNQKATDEEVKAVVDKLNL